jgi:hypothetical protein
LHRPYGQTEVFLTVQRTHPFCYEFSDIKISLKSQCEYDADDVYQYRTVLEGDKVSVAHPVWDEKTLAWSNADGAETTAVGASFGYGGSSDKAFHARL